MTEQEWVEQERAAFESKYPPENYCLRWDGTSYVTTKPSCIGLAVIHTDMFNAWLAAKREAVPDGWQLISYETLSEVHSCLDTIANAARNGHCPRGTSEIACDAIKLLFPPPEDDDQTSRIEKLRAENGRLRKALEDIKEDFESDRDSGLRSDRTAEYYAIARAALEKVNHTG